MDSQGPHSKEQVFAQSQHVLDQIEQRYKGENSILSFLKASDSLNL